MTPLVGACKRTSDVALTFRWLLALGLRLLLLQLPAPLSLQHWILILSLPVDMTVGTDVEMEVERRHEGHEKHSIETENRSRNGK